VFLLDRLARLFEQTIEGLGYELWGIEGGRQGGSQLIRVYIDNETGITLSDCEKVSRQVADLIEAEQAIVGQYTLEVSSPGICRRFFNLEQHRAYTGSMVKVKLYELLDGRKTYSGVLEQVLEESLVINEGGRVVTLKFSKVDRSSLVETI